MNQHSIRLAMLASALAAPGAASAMPAAVPAAADLCVVYPYYGQTTTLVPGWSPATEPTASAQPASRAVIDEWGVVETAEDLERVLAAYRHGQYHGL